MVRRSATHVVIAATMALGGLHAGAQVCTRPAAGSEAVTPHEVRSVHGQLELSLTFHHEVAGGADRYCYTDAAGNLSPTLRVSPGDSVVLHFRNASTGAGRMAAMPEMALNAHVCAASQVDEEATNLHFHGMAVPPECHQDDVLHTAIAPGTAPYTYTFHVPLDEHPGLYWYHPHLHGLTTRQVLGGASGAIVVEGLAKAQPLAAGVPERVLVIRDQQLIHPDAPPSPSEPAVPRALVEADGDIANGGTGYGKPAKDLSVNMVPVPYPDYPPAAITMQAGGRELWRVVNASAITYLNLALLVRGAPQQLGLVALDGVPLNSDGKPEDGIRWQDHLGMPPGSRMEFLVDAPAAGADLVTRYVDTGPGGENDPNRVLARIRLGVTTASTPRQLDSPRVTAHTMPWLGDVAPARERHFYFSEKLADPADPASAVEFYLTEAGHTPRPFDPAATEPDVTVQAGTVEDWVIENRSRELHDFHIHGLHFLLLDYAGRPVREPFLRDTVNVPYFNGKTLSYPSVRLRLDFRDAALVGTLVYHCHILEHEDKGMMGKVRVVPAAPAPAAR